MNLPISAKVNQKRHLEIGGVDLLKLAADFGTPLYVLDEATIRENCRKYLKAFSENYPGDKFSVSYAAKALCVKALLKIIAQENLWLDVVSGGELFTARAVNFPMNHIFFHGNNKSNAEIQEALSAKIGYFVIDNTYEFDRILENLTNNKLTGRTYLRVVPEIKADTHQHITTGQRGSKFGLTKEEAISLIKRAKNSPLEISGIHAHIGSQIMDLKTFSELAEKMVLLLKEIETKTKVLLPAINLGGGLGVAYLSSDPAPAIEDYVKIICETVKKSCQTAKLELPFLSVEPGRSIIAQAGLTLYKVGTIKSQDGLKIVAVDGGMSDNPRPILYDAEYEAVLPAKPRDKKYEKVMLVGKFCESGDILIKETRLPPLFSGEIVAVLATGAYNYAMASNYNRVNRPAMVLVNEGNAETIVERETYADLTAKDKLPGWFKEKK